MKRSRGFRKREGTPILSSRLILERLEDRILFATMLALPTELAAAVSTSALYATDDAFGELNTFESNDNLSPISDYEWSTNDDGVDIIEFENGAEAEIEYDDNGRPYFEYDGAIQYLDMEGHDYAEPTDVIGAPLWGGTPLRSAVVTAKEKPMSFDDVMQAQSPTCAFAATLSAVARTDFSLPSGIILRRQISPGNLLFGVRLYQPDSQGFYQPRWVDVPFDGHIYSTDLQSTDDHEFWPVVYQRAYLQLMEETGTNAANIGQAFRTLTGKTYSYYVPTGSPSTEAQKLKTALDAGKPVMAATRDNGPLVLDSSGLIRSHAYTVLGIETGANGIFVTVRNPWAVDTEWTIFDTNADHDLSLEEEAAWRPGLDGNNDGIIRIPWATFANNFTQVVIGSLTGPPSNQPLSTKHPNFNQVNVGPFIVNEGGALGPIDLSAVSQTGGTLSYHLYKGDPGTISANGQYTLSASANNVGSYNVTVVAQKNLFESYTLTFHVDVLASKPRIGSFESDLIAVTTTGNETVTLTAKNVVTDLGQIDVVEFIKDVNGNGVPDFDDARLAEIPGHAGNTTYAWSGLIPNLTPGTATIFARAGRYIQSSIVYSDVKQVTLQVGDSSVPTLTTKVGSETAVNTSSLNAANAPFVAYDQLGNSYAFFQNTTTNQIYLQRYNAAGTTNGSAVALSQVQGTLKDVDVLPDGRFAIAWVVSVTDVRIKEFNADGTPANGTSYYQVPSDTRIFDVKVATSAPGQVAAVIRYGTFGSTTAKYYRYANGSRIATQTLGGAEVGALALKMDARGISLVGWSTTSQAAKSQRFDLLGNALGSAVTINAVAGSVTTSAGISVAIDEKGRYVFTWAAFNAQANYIAARRFLGDGTPVDTVEFRVNDSLASPSIAPEASFRRNHLVITWVGRISPSYNTIYGQAYSWENSLLPLGGNFVPSTNVDIAQLDQGVAVDYTGKGFTVTWFNTFGAQNNVRLQRFTGLDVTPRSFALQAAPGFDSTLYFLSENVPLGTVIGAFQASEAGKWTYQLASGNGSTDNGAFQIENNWLRIKAAVDFETKKAYVIRVRATPETGLAIEQVFNLSVSDTFDGDGSVLTDFGFIGPVSDQADSVTVLTDGKFMVVGNVKDRWQHAAIARYNANGSLDPSFGIDGRVSPDLLPGMHFLTGVAQQTDGKVIVSGWGVNGSTQDWLVARLNSDGSLDSSFDGDGKVTTDFGGNDAAYAMVLQSDGRILVAGTAQTAPGNQLFPLAVTRYEANGALDATFGSNGKATLSIGTAAHYAKDLALMPDGRIVVVGDYLDGSESKAFVARFLSNGNPDTTFDGDGYRTFDLLPGSDSSTSVALQSDGKIVVAGTFGLLRLNTNGSPDSSFGSGGVVTTLFGSSPITFQTLVLQPDGRIIAGGRTSSGGNYDFLLARYLSTGILDSSLDGDGILQKDLGGSDIVTSMQMLLDGQVVMAGSIGGAASDFALVRVDLDTAPAATVAAPLMATAGRPVHFVAGAVDPSLIDQNAGFLYQFDWNGDGTFDETVYGLSGAGVDHAFAAPGTYSIRMTATDQDGKMSGVVTASLTVAPPVQFVVGFDPVTGVWQGSTLTGSGPGIMKTLATWAPKSQAGWQNGVQGDFNGDGVTDVAARKSNGTWTVGASGGGTYATGDWGWFTPDYAWGSVQVADVNGDGKDDLVGYLTAWGQWWAGISTGTSFENHQLVGWSTSVTWTDFLVADFSGDGRTDVAARTTTGQWWMGITDPTTTLGSPVVANQHVDYLISWAGDVTWKEVKAADYNGDGKMDIVGRAIFAHTPQTNFSQWWLSQVSVVGSNDLSGGLAPIGGFVESAGWTTLIADINGDGKDDIVSRTTGGNWFRVSDPNPVYLGAWAPVNAIWKASLVGDVDGDGKDDLIGRKSDGSWLVSRFPNGDSSSQANNQSAATWSSTVDWLFTAVGKDSGSLFGS